MSVDTNTAKASAMAAKGENAASGRGDAFVTAWVQVPALDERVTFWALQLRETTIPIW